MKFYKKKYLKVVLNTIIKKKEQLKNLDNKTYKNKYK